MGSAERAKRRGGVPGGRSDFFLRGSSGTALLKVLALFWAVTFLVRAADNNGTEETRTSQPTPGPFFEESGGWRNYTDRSFFFEPDNLTWADAEKNCLSMSAHLASVHSEPEHDFIKQLVRDASGSNTRSWIGATDCQKNNVWFWSDGSDFAFTAWSFRQPDNQNNSQACVQINFGVLLQWDDTFCDNLRPSICARKIQ